jgi:hypothetical protein
MKNALAILALLLPASGLAQGLGDTAARERQKREEKKTAAPAKVFTNQDLPEDSAPARGGEASKTPADPDPGKGGAEPAPEDPLDREREERKLQEAEWRVRFANAREQLAIAEAASWQEVVRTEFYNGIPVQMKVKEQIETEGLKSARKALADLEEEFRRTGLPPGWARD